MQAMDITPVLDGLNDAQRNAVSAPPINMLVLAGAGSGKTRVLVHRIAWIVQTEGISPYGILSVTFTNKAAAEMRQRIEDLLDIPAQGMWVGTFHGIALRVLRAHHAELDLPRTFQVIDSDDQLRMVKRVMRELELDDAKWPPKQAQWYINGKKDAGLRPKSIEPGYDPMEKTWLRVYEAYEVVCRGAGLVDFAELLLRAHELWLNRPDILDHYRKRFKHILVDEFQDTNEIQYAWLRLLAGETGKMFIVGDDDQSIYGWRGAKIENIHKFQRDFPDVKLHKLEQNYRSTGTILQAANTLIRFNADRLGKELWTAGEDGELIKYYSAFNEQDEARFVVETVEQWVEQGNLRRDSAILYRSNAQSRILEEALLMRGIPYRVYGGMRFFDRQEIKDALAYLRLIANRKDDAAFDRIINVPTRGIGGRTVQLIREKANEKRLSYWDAAADIVATKSLPARALNAVQGFVERVCLLEQGMAESDIGDMLQNIIDQTGLIEHYKKDRGERGRARIENLAELVGAARQFEAEDASVWNIDEPEEADNASGEEATDALANFLAYTSLESGESQAGPGDDCVQMMTLHTAKGLEFPLVFLVGMEEGLFPHERSMDDSAKLEEERRLAYVGITRAKQHLYLSSAEHRRLYGRDTRNRPSRFIAELPAETLAEIRPQVNVSTSSVSVSSKSPVYTEELNGLSIGQRVMHGKFGEGVLLNVEGSGEHIRVQVNFTNVGQKWLMLAYANLLPA